MMRKAAKKNRLPVRRSKTRRDVAASPWRLLGPAELERIAERVIRI